MPTIQSYRFGKMVIDGKAVGSDLMIFPDGKIQKNWRRRKGHFLEYTDIKPFFDSFADICPQVLIIGTGAFGLMKIDSKLVDQLTACFAEKSINQTIKLIHQRTSKAVITYQEAVQTGKTVCACFHLTC